MALSQKYPGLMIVPWFNRHEWRYVKDLIMSNEELKLKEGLDLLKIWKCRSPNLPSGVESTLILLTALVQDREASQDRRFRCYSFALLRFLNISCDQRDKQGTFYRTAKKVDIPEWLIDFRHALAHGQNLPGGLEVEEALCTSLNWLRDKYWQMQDNTLGDYIKEEVNITALVVDVYCNIIVNSYLNKQIKSIKQLKQIDPNFNEKISKVQQNYAANLKGSIEDAKEVLEAAIKDICKNQKGENNMQEIVKIVVKYLNSELIDISDKVQVPIEIENLWKDLLNLLYTGEMLSTLILELLKQCNLPEFYELNNNSLKLASLWLKHLFQWMNREMSLNDDDHVSEGIKHVLEHMKSFELAANSIYNPYTYLYLESLLRFGGCSDSYIQNRLNDIDSMLNKSANKTHDEICVDTIMFDVPENISVIDGKDDNDQRGQFSTNFNEPDLFRNADTYIYSEMTTRCALVSDPTMFENCPLGVLPTQTTMYNSLIDFN